MPLKDCRTEISDTFVDYADFSNNAMPIYNLIEYSDSYSDTSGSIWYFKRDEIVNNADVSNDGNVTSFKYKASIIGNAEQNGRTIEVKIVVPLKHLSNFWRSLEMPLINCKVELSLNWIEICLLTVANTATFKITDAKLYVPIIILSAEDNAKLSKLLNKVFKRPVYCNKYKVIDNIPVHIAAQNEEKHVRELLDSSWQGVKRLFTFAYDNTANDNQVSVDFYKNYFLPRIKIKNWNIEIDGRNFYDQPMNESIKQYGEIRKKSTGQCHDYTTGCLLDFAYLEKKYRLIAIDASKQKALDADPRAIQQIIFTGKMKATEANTRAIILEKSKETMLEFAKGTTKVL